MRAFLLLVLSACCFGQGTGLTSPGANTDTIGTLSADTALNNVSTGTMIACGTWTSVATTTQRIFDKLGNQRLQFAIRDTANGDFRLGYNRNPSNLNILSVSNTVTTGTYQCLAATWDAAGANSDQHLYRGTKTTEFVEVSYATQLVGSGTHDDASVPPTLGNGAGLSTSLAATLDYFYFSSHKMSLGELKGQQFDFHAESGCLLMIFPGKGGTGTQRNYCGKANSSTSSGYTLANGGAPLPSAFGR